MAISFGPCNGDNGAEAFTLTVAVPRAVEELHLGPSNIQWNNSATVSIRPGLWAVTFNTSWKSWGSMEHIYPIIRQSFTAQILESVSNIAMVSVAWPCKSMSNVHMAESNGAEQTPYTFDFGGNEPVWPPIGEAGCGREIPTPITEPGQGIPVEYLPEYRECARTFYFNYGCANCQKAISVYLRVLAATTLGDLSDLGPPLFYRYPRNAVPFNVSAFGTYIG